MCKVTIQRVTAPSIFDVLPAEVVSNEATSNDRKRPLEDACHEDEDDNSSSSTSQLRSGKWTNEEEVYADALIAKFENGTLSDCPEGKTLRAYLSKKLNCIPMRVSKKYGGKCIGKHSYTHSASGDSEEEIERMGQMAAACWTSIERRIKNRRKRAKRSKVATAAEDSNSDTAESLTQSDHTDKDELMFDDMLFDNFFADGTSFDLNETSDSQIDWVSALADDCLLLF